jgi:two-component system, cell cycle response regulator DivK
MRVRLCMRPPDLMCVERFAMAKILVVEDDPLTSTLLTRILSSDQHEVITADDGLQGVMHARTDHPDLIIMDIGLPTLNGLQATQRIRAMPSTRTTPIIVLSAFASEDSRLASLQAGCDVYQTKPINFNTLREAIRALLDRSPKAQE